MHTATPPTQKQLAYLRVLASRNGTTFVVPKTKQEASRSIAQMKGWTPCGAQEKRDARYERSAIQTDLVSQAFRVSPEEIEGHGREATWNKGFGMASQQELPVRESTYSATYYKP